jgi:hypothetical protein
MSFLSSSIFARNAGAQNLASSAGRFYRGRLPLVEKATSYTVLPTDRCGTRFVAKTGAVTFTLPTPSLALLGHWFQFANGVNANMTVTFATADTGITTNDLGADSVAASTSSKKIGAVIEVVCVTIDAGSTYQWIAYGVAGGDGIAYTVAS